VQPAKAQWLASGRVELLGLGRSGQRHGLGVGRDRGGDEVEVAGADLALVAGGGVAGLLGRELGFLQPDVGGPALVGKAPGQLEQRV
jgi:hypothetical protein